MIISASRRSDIPAFYSNWFFHRLEEGFVLVRNPMYFHQVAKISLSRDVVDGIVFWTKNPSPMLSNLEKLKDFPFYFQFTLNSYGVDVEPNVPSKNNVIIPTFQELSRKIGKERVLWRYDPIFFNEKYTLSYHIEYFSRLSEKLCQYTERCTISFLDDYRHIRSRVKDLNIEEESQERTFLLSESFSKIAQDHGFLLQTCAESIDLSQFQINHGQCIELKKLQQVGGCPLTIEKDKNQRKECGCVSSIDIGMYSTCNHQCLYCYANQSQKIVVKKQSFHDVTTPLLCSFLEENDQVKEREVSTCRREQISLFD